MLKRLDEDFKFTRQNDTQKLLRQLSIGSRQYYDELTGINGPYHHLNISEAILGGISKPSEVKSFNSTRLQTTVKDIAGEEYFLDNRLQILWQQPKRHFILLGDGGMGKTVSLINLWKTLLNNNQEREVGTIPIFLTLHEYNTVSEQERDGFIAKRICWHYLGLKENRGATIDALWDAIKTNSEKEVPSMVLLLDGFNEVTTDTENKRHLLMELNELRQKDINPHFSRYFTHLITITQQKLSTVPCNIRIHCSSFGRNEPYLLNLICYQQIFLLVAKEIYFLRNSN